MSHAIHTRRGSNSSRVYELRPDTSAGVKQMRRRMGMYAIHMTTHHFDLGSKTTVSLGGTKPFV
jgi:hypothetical protein